MKAEEGIRKLLREHQETTLRAEVELLMVYGFGSELAKAVRQAYLEYSAQRGGRGYTKMIVNVLTFMICWSYATVTEPAPVLAIGFWTIVGFSFLSYTLAIAVKSSALKACLDFQMGMANHQPTEFFLSIWLDDKKNARFIIMCFQNRYRTPNALVTLLRIGCFIGTLYACIQLGYALIALVLAVLYTYKHYLKYQLQLHTAECLKILRQARSEVLQKSDVIEMHFVL